MAILVTVFVVRSGSDASPNVHGDMNSINDLWKIEEPRLSAFFAELIGANFSNEVCLFPLGSE